MTVDEKKNYLKHYRVLLCRIKRLREMIKLYPENTGSYKNGIEESQTLRQKIENEIERVDGGLLTEILSLKYICGKTVEEIALNICYSKRQTERLHLKALENLCIS